MTTLQDLVAEWRKRAEAEPGDMLGVAIAVAYRTCANQLEAVLREEDEK